MPVSLEETLFGEVTLGDGKDLREEDSNLRGHCERNRTVEVASECPRSLDSLICGCEISVMASTCVS